MTRPDSRPAEPPIVIDGEIHGGEPTDIPDTELPSPMQEPPAAASASYDRPTDPVAAPPADRISSLDALRGMFVVAITVTFALYGDWYPTWMYHRQFPPPGDFVDIPGITWLDVPYAGFLFTAAAAIPLALSRRVSRGVTEISIILAAIRRFLLLAVFALLIGHANTYFTGYTQEARVLAIVGFAIMFGIFVQRRPDWNPRVFKAMQVAAWLAAAAFLALGPMVYGSTFSVERRDQVILDIAFAVLSGSILWYFTRENTGTRVAALGLAVALHISARRAGWVGPWWWDSPATWLIMPAKLVLLAIAVPGTIAGDLLLRWTRLTTPPRWTARRLVGLAVVGLAFAPVLVVGMYGRMSVMTPQIVIALIAVGIALTWNPPTERDRLLRSFFAWGALWMLIGLFLEPAEGGIKKVPETLSYFFTMAGLSTMLLLAFVVLVDVVVRADWARSFIDVGRNPMLAYVLYSIFLNSALELIPAFRTLLRATPAQALLRTLLSTVLVVLLVQVFTRRRVIWRT